MKTSLKSLLLGTVAAGALVVMASAAQAGETGYGDHGWQGWQGSENVSADDRSENGVGAGQLLGSSVRKNNVEVKNVTNGGGSSHGGHHGHGHKPQATANSQNGDVTYEGQTFNAPGVFTLQNTTGLNEAANNGTNIAAQINSGAKTSIDLDDGSKNWVAAGQYMGSFVEDSTTTVTNYVGEEDPTSRTGDVAYNGTTFNSEGVYTLQNNTGINTAANNGTNIAAQMNSAKDSINLDDHSKNLVIAGQFLEASVAGSTADVTNSSPVAPVASRTGDVTYAGQTFNAPGLYTLQNNTGIGTATSNGLNLAVQANGPLGGI